MSCASFHVAEPQRRRRRPQATSFVLVLECPPFGSFPCPPFGHRGGTRSIPHRSVGSISVFSHRVVPVPFLSSEKGRTIGRRGEAFLCRKGEVPGSIPVVHVGRGGWNQEETVVTTAIASSHHPSHHDPFRAGVQQTRKSEDQQGTRCETSHGREQRTDDGRRAMPAKKEQKERGKEERRTRNVAARNRPRDVPDETERKRDTLKRTKHEKLTSSCPPNAS